MGAGVIFSILSEEQSFGEEELLGESPLEFSARIIPELEQSFKRKGFLTALITLDSPRFRHYLKKPRNLLHDRWRFQERGKSPGVLYSLDTGSGVAQEIIMDRKAAKAVLKTYAASSGLEQSIVFDMKEKRIVSNTVTYKYAQSTGVFHYLYLNEQKGVLKSVEPALPEREPAELAD